MKREDSYWVDVGMGQHYGQILREAEAARGSRVLAWTYVISPDPLLMAHIPADQQAGVVANISENVMDHLATYHFEQ